MMRQGGTSFSRYIWRISSFFMAQKPHRTWTRVFGDIGEQNRGEETMYREVAPMILATNVNEAVA